MPSRLCQCLVSVFARRASCRQPEDLGAQCALGSIYGLFCLVETTSGVQHARPKQLKMPLSSEKVVDTQRFGRWWLPLRYFILKTLQGLASGLQLPLGGGQGLPATAQLHTLAFFLRPAELR